MGTRRIRATKRPQAHRTGTTTVEQCNNIWKLDGEHQGDALWYKVYDPMGPIYNYETLAPFERSGHSIKGGFEFRTSTVRGIVTTLCDKHRASLAELHPGWRIEQTQDPLAE